MSILTTTIKLQLYVNQDQKQLLEDMSEQYRQACNYVSEYIFQHDLCLKTKILNDELYHVVRDRFRLKSQMAQSVLKTVVARYKTIKEQYRQKPFRFQDDDGKTYFANRSLEWLQNPPYFQRKQVDLVMERDYSFKNNFELLSLNTLSNRIVIPFESKHFRNDIVHSDYKLGTGKIVSSHGKWYFHIPVTQEVPDFDKAKVNHVVGIDRGLRFLATSYDEKGHTSFI